MKKIITTIVFFVLTSCSLGNEIDPTSEVKALLKQKEYSKAFGLLRQTVRDQKLSPSQRAQALKAQAQFYEEFMGNFDGALRLYKKILRIELPREHPMKSSAIKEIARLNSLEQKYSKQNRLLKKARIATSKPTKEKKRIEQIELLQNFIRDNPEYYKLAEAYYYLGLNYMALKKYGESYRLFEKCLKLKPCIDFYLPVGIRANLSRGYWVASIVRRTAWDTIGVLLVFTVVIFYVSRPWQWIKPGYLIVGLAMVLFWWVTFNVSHKLLAGSFEAEKDIALKISAEMPCFVNAAPKSPGHEVAKKLFLYGLVGVLGVFVFSTGVSKLKCKPLKLLINSLFGLLLFICLIAIFYMRYCYLQSKFTFKEESKLSCINGHLYFILTEPEPYILTNPKAYPNLATRNITDSYSREWVERHCQVHPEDKKNNSLQNTSMETNNEKK